MTFSNLLEKDNFTREDLISMLSATGRMREKLYEKSLKVKNECVGEKVYLRGLIEFSNICLKDCYYCGIRKGNKHVSRYNLSDLEILAAARFAYENNYGSIVIQGGETASDIFTRRIEKLLVEIKKQSDNKLGITLSLGEQTKETLHRWREAGAHRYLLRIESSNREIYKKIHPQNASHTFEKRLDCIKNLQDLGYQTGTGVMIGLPFQSIEHLADDLIFMKEMDVDMVGMGPYIEHPDTPLYQYKSKLLPVQERLTLSLNMIACLRIYMKDINIAAATALQAIDTYGREKALKIGANILMPNITPKVYRRDYSLYENKPFTTETHDESGECPDDSFHLSESKMATGEWGDSIHYKKRVNSKLWQTS